jgi:hypothetical protein
MDFIIFKNKYIKYRKEDFGGLVSVNNFLYLLDKTEYRLIKKIEQIKYIKESELDADELEIAKKLVHNKIFLKIDLEKAEKILNRNID